MTHADHSAQDGLRLELSQLWMLPLILLRILLAAFETDRADLKELRRRKALRGSWQTHYEDLRQAEWGVRYLLARKARRFLAGEPIDIAHMMVPWAPADWRPPMPHSPEAMCLRFEDAARFHADPESFIRRHAARIAARTAAQADRPSSTNAQTSRSPHGGEERSRRDGSIQWIDPSDERAQRASVEPRGRLSPAPEHIRAPP